MREPELSDASIEELRVVRKIFDTLGHQLPSGLRERLGVHSEVELEARHRDVLSHLDELIDEKASEGVEP